MYSGLRGKSSEFLGIWNLLPSSGVYVGVTRARREKARTREKKKKTHQLFEIRDVIAERSSQSDSTRETVSRDWSKAEPRRVSQILVFLTSCVSIDAGPFPTVVARSSWQTRLSTLISGPAPQAYFRVPLVDSLVFLFSFIVIFCAFSESGVALRVEDRTEVRFAANRCNVVNSSNCFLPKEQAWIQRLKLSFM